MEYITANMFGFLIKLNYIYNGESFLSNYYYFLLFKVSSVVLIDQYQIQKIFHCEFLVLVGRSDITVSR